MTGGSPAERKAQYLDMARAMTAAADSATSPAVRAQYLELAGKWTRLAEEIDRRLARSALYVVGEDDLPSAQDDDSGPAEEATVTLAMVPARP